MTNQPPIDANQPTTTRIATFAMGCFWGLDGRFGAVPGVVRTRVGYAGGQKDTPTYHSLGDHIETIEMDYDPEMITYEALLRLFWEGHNPVRQSYKRQYMNVVFYHDEDQRQCAENTMQQEAANHEREVVTELMAYDGFHLAEDYHQKYQLQKHDRLMEALGAYYPDVAGLVGSTAAARMNGFVSGYGQMARLREEISQYGLPHDAESRLLEVASRRH